MASFRLTKAAKDLNVGIQTLVEYLAKKGHQVELNPNTKISEEQYELLAAAFHGERKVKEEADKIELVTGANRVVELQPKEQPEAESEEVFIKTYASPVAAPAPEPAPEPEPMPEPEPRPEPEPEPQPVEAAAVAEEPVAEAAEEASGQAESASPLKVLGTVDLASLNQRTRPDKKKRPKKGEKAAPAPAPAAAEKPAP